MSPSTSAYLAPFFRQTRVQPAALWFVAVSCLAVQMESLTTPAKFLSLLALYFCAGALRGACPCANASAALAPRVASPKASTSAAVAHSVTISSQNRFCVIAILLVFSARALSRFDARKALKSAAKNQSQADESCAMLISQLECQGPPFPRRA